MARSLLNKTRVASPNGNFTRGRIQDGSTTGTPVDEEIYGDFHQFFELMSLEAGITFNEIADDQVTNQFFQALINLIQERQIFSGTQTGAVNYVTSPVLSLPDTVNLFTVPFSLLRNSGARQLSGGVTLAYDRINNPVSFQVDVRTQIDSNPVNTIKSVTIDGDDPQLRTLSIPFAASLTTAGSLTVSVQVSSVAGNPQVRSLIDYNYLIV